MAAPPPGNPLPPLPVADSVFVPLEEDLSAPFTKPATRVDRIKAAIASVEAHSVKVKGNILEVYDREKARLWDEAEHREEQSNKGGSEPERPVRMDRADMTAMTKNLKTPAVLGGHYNVKNIPRPNFDKFGPSSTLRGEYSRQISSLVETAVEDVGHYDQHVQRTLGEYRRALQREEHHQAELEKRKLQESRGRRPVGM